MPIPMINYGARGIDADSMAAIRKHAGKSILDFGCGGGQYVFELAKAHDVMGVDIGQFDSWRKAPQLFSQVATLPLDFKDGRFETVVCLETLEHCPEPEKYIKEFRRLCSRNVIITVPNCDETEGMETSRLVYRHFLDKTHCNWFNLDTVTKLVEDSGFRIVESSLINEISVIPLLNEACGGGFGAFIARQVYKFFRVRRYCLSCLIVAEKTAR